MILIESHLIQLILKGIYLDLRVSLSTLLFASAGVVAAGVAGMTGVADCVVVLGVALEVALGVALGATLSLGEVVSSWVGAG
jgi:hypothetical protein